MKDSVYIIVHRRGIVASRKTNQFTLQPGEKAFRLVIEIPDSVFKPAAIPTVNVTVPSEQANWSADTITAELVTDP